MRRRITTILWLAAYALAAIGCSASVYQTDESFGVEVKRLPRGNPQQLPLDLQAGTRNDQPLRGDHEKSDSSPIEPLE
jgi:hypothetical protein